MGSNWSSTCAAAQARSLSAGLDMLYSCNSLLLAAYALALVAFTVRGAQWYQIPSNYNRISLLLCCRYRLAPTTKDAVWPLYVDP